MSGQAEASIPGGRGSDEGNVSAYFGVSSELDNRSLSLSRSNASGEWTTYEDGVQVTHGDTIYSFMRDQMGPAYPQTTLQSFSAAYNGNWSTTFANFQYNTTWNWVAPGLTSKSETQLSTTQDMPMGQLTDKSSVSASQREWSGTPKGP